MSTGSPLFILFGSSPGIGLALAKAFATKHFTRILLCARNASRLQQDEQQVEAAVRAAGMEVDVATFVLDLNDLEALLGKLKEIERLFLDAGGLGCVWHNVASVKYSEVLTTALEEIEQDMGTNALSLYIIAQWSIPHLLKSPHATPSLLATNSHLPEQPMPILLSLSMAKAAQQNLVTCLHEAFGEKIHFGVVKVCGLVSEEAAVLNPTEIARRAMEFWEGGREAGTQLVVG